jgi:hypothetical protein
MLVCFVCCQVEVWSLVQRSPTDCSASLCVIIKLRGRGGHSPRWAAEPEKIINALLCYLSIKLHRIYAYYVNITLCIACGRSWNVLSVDTGALLYSGL